MISIKDQTLPPHCSRAVKELKDLEALHVEYGAAKTKAIESGKMEEAKRIAAQVIGAIATLEATVEEYRITIKRNLSIKEILRTFYGDQAMENIRPSSTLISPSSINYSEYISDIDPT